MTDIHFTQFTTDNLIFASLEKKAILKKIKENPIKGIDRNTLVFELEMERIYHKNDLNKEICSMIKNDEIILEEISVDDGTTIEVLKINNDN